MTGDPVYVKLTRPEGYEDACEQIVIEDAEIHPGFMPEPATEEIERLQAENERLRARGIEDMQFEIRQLRAAIAWALGYSSFRPREDGEGAYWWRKELRERSGLTSEQLERALPTKNTAEDCGDGCPGCSYCRRDSGNSPETTKDSRCDHECDPFDPLTEVPVCKHCGEVAEALDEVTNDDRS